MKRVAILDRGFVSPYWRDLFSLLNSQSTHEFTVYHSEPPRGTGLKAADGPYDFPNHWVRHFEIPFLGGTVIYQPVFWRVLLRHDVLIVSHELKFVASMLLAVAFRILRRPVIFWGFGYHARRGFGYADRDNPLVTRLLSKLKDKLTFLSSAYLAYTPGGRESLERIGYPVDRIWVVRQAVNMEQQTRLHEKYLTVEVQELRSSLGLEPDSIVFLYIGRIVGAKRVGDVVRLVQELNRVAVSPTVEARIIGTGPDLAMVEELAHGTKQVGLLGEIYDQDEVAKYLRVADAVVLPGAGGITVTHAFAHGVPVLTRELDSHSPEVEYVEDGINGLKVAGDYSDYVKEVAKFVADKNLRDRLVGGAFRMRETLSLAHMSTQFISCVDAITRSSP
jgi:glycosyltransferase involved in cell wall biosynthesis